MSLLDIIGSKINIDDILVPVTTQVNKTIETTAETVAMKIAEKTGHITAEIVDVALINNDKIQTGIINALNENSNYILLIVAIIFAYLYWKWLNTES